MGSVCLWRVCACGEYVPVYLWRVYEIVRATDELVVLLLSFPVCVCVYVCVCVCVCEQIRSSTVHVQEGGVHLALTVVDTPGYGDVVDNSQW